MRDDSIFKNIVDLDLQYFKLREELFDTLDHQIDELVQQLQDSDNTVSHKLALLEQQVANTSGDLIRRDSELKTYVDKLAGQVDALEKRIDTLEAKKRRKKKSDE